MESIFEKLAYHTKPTKKRQFNIDLRETKSTLSNYIACCALVSNSQGQEVEIKDLYKDVKQQLDEHDKIYRHTTVELEEDVLTIRERDKIILLLGYKEVFEMPIIDDQENIY